MLLLPPVGRYMVRLQSVKEEDNKDKSGKNLKFTFTIDEGDFEGKPIDVYCALGKDMGIATIRAIYCAVKAIDSQEAEDLEFDPTDLIGGTCIGELTHRLYQGNQLPQMNTFYASGSVSLDTPF